MKPNTRKKYRIGKIRCNFFFFFFTVRTISNWNKLSRTIIGLFSLLEILAFEIDLFLNLKIF